MPAASCCFAISCSRSRTTWIFPDHQPSLDFGCTRDGEHTHLLLVLPDLVALQFQAVNDYILGRVAGHWGWTYSRMARSCFVTFGTDWFPPITTPPNLNDGARDMRARSNRSWTYGGKLRDLHSGATTSAHERPGGADRCRFRSVDDAHCHTPVADQYILEVLISRRHVLYYLIE